MKVGVMGAGAVGCYYGAMLARAGHAVTLIGRPAHVQAVTANGLRMQTLSFDETVPLSASTGPCAVAGADVVLFSGDKPAGISVGDLADGVLNEVEKPAHLRQRFTLGY